MNVFILRLKVEYEPGQIYGVYATREGAAKAAEVHMQRLFGRDAWAGGPEEGWTSCSLSLVIDEREVLP